MISASEYFCDASETVVLNEVSDNVTKDNI